METQTRDQHLAYCKDRALKEYDFYLPSEGHRRAVTHAITSMVSDLRKHPHTISSATESTAGLAMGMIAFIRTRQELVDWINGYN